MNKAIEKLIEMGPEVNEAYDVNTPEAHRYFSTVNEEVTKLNLSLDALSTEALESYGNKALAFRTMLKFISSLRVIKSLEEPVLLTLINPVYKERGRMSKRSEHPHGENSLRTKIETLRFFNSLNSNFEGRIFVIDDECPEASGEMAQTILDEYDGQDNRVYFLGSALVKRDVDLPAGLTEKSGSNRSVKGGSVLYGMRKALETSSKGRHIIVDNDADLSIHPMQLGLVLDDIINNGVDAVAGSRREKDAVALIGGERNSRGELFIKIWQSLLPELARDITDTNRAFKAFDSLVLTKILDDIKIYTFPYQIELLQACISKGLKLNKKGIAYIDSEAASTQSGANITETYLNQIHQIIDIAKRYKTLPNNHPLVEFFLGISEDEWMRIEANPPASIEEFYTR